MFVCVFLGGTANPSPARLVHMMPSLMPQMTSKGPKHNVAVTVMVGGLLRSKQTVLGEKNQAGEGTRADPTRG